MKYEFEDVLRLKLPKERLYEFLDLINSEFHASKYSYEVFFMSDYENGMRNVMTSITKLVNFKNSVNYVLSDSPVERAKLAFVADTFLDEKKVLEIWLRVVSEMTSLEKIMEGWNKI